MQVVPGEAVPKSSVKLTDNGKVIRRVATLLRRRNIRWRDIQIGRSVLRDQTYVIVVLENGQKVTGDVDMFSGADEYGASTVTLEDTFIAKCHMLE